jgi:SAM-dependent methyltransferase
VTQAPDSNARLVRHYDSKYDPDDPSANPVPSQPRFPHDRFESCRAHFPTFFHGGSILELGAGSGLVAHWLLRDGLVFDRYVLSELSESRLDGLRGSFDDPRVTAIAVDADQIPVDGSVGRFDAIVMIALIEHLIDPLGAMRRLRDVLNAGGFVWIDTPNIAKYTRRLKLLAGRFPSTASVDEGLATYAGETVDLYDEGHLHYFTYRSLSHMLVRHCGFSSVVRVPYGCEPLPRPIAHPLAKAWPEMFSDVCVVAYA